MANDVPVVAVLGGGFAGLKAALILERELGKKEAEIVLVDQSPYHTLRPKLPQAIGGRIPCAVHVPFTEFIGDKRIRFIQDSVTGIDPDGPRIQFEEGELQADYLIIALGGASRAPNAALMPAWTFGQACGARLRLEAMIRAAKAGEPANASIVVVGAGFVGVEVAAEVQHKLRRLGATELGAKTILFEKEARILPRLPAKAATITERRLKQLGVEIRTATEVTDAVPGTDYAPGIGYKPGADAEPGKVILADGETVTAGTLIWAGGAGPAAPVAQSPLADETGLAPLDGYLRVVNQPNIYVAGDCGYLMRGEAETYEPSAHRAEAQAEVVAANIVADLRGKERGQYRPEPQKYLLGLGPGFGVLASPSGPILGGFVPSIMKEIVIQRHLAQVGGSALASRTRQNVMGRALRSKYWDTPPLQEGNVCSC